MNNVGVRWCVVMVSAMSAFLGVRSDAGAECYEVPEGGTWGWSCDGQLPPPDVYVEPDGTTTLRYETDSGAEIAREQLGKIRGIRATAVAAASRSVDARDAVVDLTFERSGVGAATGMVATGIDLGQRVLLRELNATVDVEVPHDTVDRAEDPSGRAVDLDEDGDLADPVDPVTGEFYIDQVDLAFPGFGIPFAHHRTYRSRIDYDGPLGPGWDHGYNQRLVPEAEPPPVLDPDFNPLFGDPPPSLPDAPSAPWCGPVLILTTGEGTTLRFRETARTATAISYSSSASRLTLAGSIEDEAVTWTLTTQAGDVRRFDAAGLLVGWTDANGVGLSITWEAGIVADRRIALIADSSGRHIAYRYDDLDRLTDVVEPTSALAASYHYGEHGELRRVTRGDGRTETYEYDVLGGGRGDWIAEPQLHRACASACAVSSSSCDAGGACDGAVAAATTSCYASCGSCAATCASSCSDACDSSCSEVCNSACEYQCGTEDSQAALLAECGGLAQTTGALDACLFCSGQCQASEDALCAITGLTCSELYVDLDGSVSVTGCRVCDDDLSECCTNGTSCDEGSCNAGVDCTSSCISTFFGVGEVSDCAPPGSPVGWEPGTATTWAHQHGCVPQLTDSCVNQCWVLCKNGPVGGAPGCDGNCLSDCQPYCDAECHVADCLPYCESLAFAETCEDSCTEACVDEAHASGDNPGPRYGHPADLDYNLVRVRDGAGNLWLENTYGTDVTSPDFDTVVHQQYGEFTAAMTHVDLAAHAAGDAAAPAGEMASLVDTLDAYSTVEICPYRCEAGPVDPRDLMVPLGDLVLVFTAEGGEEPSAGGLPVTSTTVKGTIAPTLMHVVREGGVVVVTTARRSARTNLLATSSVAKIGLALPEGNVTLQSPSDGTYQVSGGKDAIDALERLGELTVFTDASNQLRAYPGHPAATVALASGSCQQPFHLEQTAGDQVRMIPADACKGDLWVAPLASAAPAELGTSYQELGSRAITTSFFRPTTFAPTRSGITWVSAGDGTLIRERSSTGDAEALAGALIATHQETTPMLSAPWADHPSLDPFYVFHQDGKSATQPPPPNDHDWHPADNAPPGYVPPCDPTLPAPAQRGVGVDAPGAQPSVATVVTDLHGVSWTLYASASNRLVRTVNHSTGAVWSFEHDPAGQVTGIEAPDGARQCLRYDAFGNVTEQLSLPTLAQPGAPTTEPVRRRFNYQTSPSRLTAVMDPRDLSHPLVQYQYDSLGNLTRAIDAAGLITKITPVGGQGADRAQPATVTDPGEAVQRFTWDVTTGTQHLHIVDATSTTPLTYEQVSDEAGRPVWSSSPLGMISTATYDGPFLAATGYQGDGKSGQTTFGYDADGKLASTIQGAHQAQFRYDAIGSMIQSRDLALDASAAEQVRCQRLAPGGRVLESVSAEGHRTRYTHDGEGRVTVIEAGDLGPSPLLWDDDCPAHPPGASVAGTVATFEYDLAGRLVASTDSRGYTSTVTVDGLGRPIVSEAADGTSTRRGYDALGNVLWAAVYAPGALVPYRPAALGDPGLLGAAQQIFDGRGRLAERRIWHVDASATAIGDGTASTRYAYNDVTRTVTVTDDLGRQTVLRSDGAGRPIETRLPDGTVLATSYLDGGRKVRRSYPLAGATQVAITRLTAWGATASTAIVAGGTEIVTGQIDYDNLLRPVGGTGASGATATTTYDAFGRSTGTSGTPGEGLTLLHDRDNRVVERQSNAGPGLPISVWTFEVDALGRSTRTIDPTGGVTSTAYEGLTSLPTLVVDRAGSRSSFTWSGTNQLTAMLAEAPASMPTTRDVALDFVRDPLGRLTSASRDDGLDGVDVTSWFTYDSLGAVITEGDTAFGAGADRVHVHDNLGRPTSSRLGPHVVTRSFDNLDRLTSVMVGTETPKTATFEYQGLGGPTARVLRNGVRTSYGRDSLGRLEKMADFRADGTSLASWTWELPLDGVPRAASFGWKLGPTTSSVFDADAGGRLTAEQHAMPGVPFTLSPTASAASAVAAVHASLGASATRYTLNGRNSWTARDQAGVHTAYELDELDAYAAVGGIEPTYDAAGAVTHDGTSSFTYDALGQLDSVKVGSTGRAFRRDALGRIIAETDPATGAVTRYAYDGLRRTFRRAPSGAVDVTIDGAGLDEHLATILATGARHYYHQDRLGSVYMVTGDAGAALEWARYTAYGEPTLRSASGAVIATSAIGNRFGFQGQAHDFATGLVDMRARHYRPTWGRFLTLDPLGLAAGPNLYAFVSASPLSFTDPLGLRQGEYAPLDPDSVLNPYCNNGCHPDRRDLAERSADLARSQEPTDWVSAHGLWRAGNGIGLMLGGAFVFVVAEPLGLGMGLVGADETVTGLRQFGTGEYKTSGVRTLMNAAVDVFGVDRSWAAAGEDGLHMALGARGAVVGLALPGATPVPAARLSSDDAVGVGIGAGAGTAPARVSKFNPTNGGSNCVRCVTSLVDDIANDGFVLPADAYARAGPFRFASEPKALEFMMENTDVTFGPRASASQGQLPKAGHYVVFGPGEGGGHVFFGWRTQGGRSFFFDPQVGRLLSPGEFAINSAYPIIYPP